MPPIFSYRRFGSTLRMLGLLAVIAASPLAVADEPGEKQLDEPRVLEQQKRAFKISIDGTERGTLTMLLKKLDDGTESMRGQTDLSFDFFVYKYRYSSAGTEVWKSGKLLRLAYEADYNGDKYIVQAAAKQRDLAFEVNGESQRTTANVWVTSYWQEPEPERVGKNLSLFDADKGRKLNGVLKLVGKEPLLLDKKTVSANRYQIRGDVEVDLWYDEDKRLMRQLSLESGHQALLELTQIIRNP